MSPQVKQGGYHITCSGQSNGAIQTLVIGGHPPYTYLWSDASTQANRSGLAAGTYMLTITDSLQAQVTDTVILYQPQALSLASQISNYQGNYAVSQHGGADGSLQILVSGGLPPYTYSWNTGATQSIISSIGAGTYSCTITDAAGCISSKSETLNAPSALQASINNVQPISCNSFSDGSAAVIASGGVAPYQYRWNSGETDSVAVNLRGGMQNVDVMDRHGASVRLSFEILEPDPLSVSTSVSSFPNGFNVSCSGCYNGSITLTASGGTAPYYIMWMDSSDSFSRTQLGGGKHNYMVSDDKGCKITDFTMLKEPERDDWSRSGNVGVDPSSQFIGTTDFTPLALKTNGQEVMRIAEDGNVGIGTSAPEYKFDVDGNVRLKQGVKLDALPEIPESLTYEQESTYKSIVLGPNGDLFTTDFPVATPINNQGECKATMDGNQIISWKSIAANPGILHAGTLNCPPLVGIGTSQPTTTLHVIGDSYIVGNSRTDFKTSASKAVFGNFGSYSEGNTILSIAAMNMPAGSSALTIDHQTGESESYRYSFVNNVNRDYTKAIVVNQSTASQESFIVYGDGTTIIGYDPANPVTPNSSTKLAVMGLLSAREVKVTLGPFPDYVFKPDYKLMEWKQLAEFIRVNGHLPGVMNEKDVEENGGAELGELTRQNLEKIEELFMYMLDMQEKIELLESENLRLKSLIIK
ncbi:MAG: SprB repeat-containing protein [Bacteroidia bacterium]